MNVDFHPVLFGTSEEIERLVAAFESCTLPPADWNHRAHNSSTVELVNGLLKIYGDKRLPLEYYSKERLMSWEARTNWVEPDLKPLD